MRDLEAVIMGLLEGQYIRTRLGSSASTSPSMGRKTSRAMLLRSCSGDVIFNSGTYRFIWKNSSNATRRRCHEIQLPLPMRLV